MRYEPNESNFFIKAKQTVFKWWCIVYKPVYKLTHHGRWPDEKQQRFDALTGHNSTSPSDDNQNLRNRLAKDIAMQIQSNNGQGRIDDIIAHVPQDDSATQPNTTSCDFQNDIPTDNVSQEVLDRANEIMERLAREAASDEAKKQAEIEEARRKAQENERLASIMNANKVDISQFIEEGKAQQALKEGDITI